LVLLRAACRPRAGRRVPRAPRRAARAAPLSLCRRARRRRAPGRLPARAARMADKLTDDPSEAARVALETAFTEVSRGRALSPRCALGRR